MSQVWELDLPSNEKMILLALADHANDQGICAPSFSRIAWKCGISKDTVKRAVKSFRETGLISKLSEAGGPGRPAVWKVCPSKGCMLHPFVSDLQRGKAVEKPVDSPVETVVDGVQAPDEWGARGVEMGCTAMPSEPKTWNRRLGTERKSAPIAHSSGCAVEIQTGNGFGEFVSGRHVLKELVRELDQKFKIPV